MSGLVASELPRATGPLVLGCGMKALPRPFQVLPLAVVLAVLTYLSFAPALGHSDATAAKDRQVQMGDPTDTDPGTASDQAKNSSKALSVQSESHVYATRSSQVARSTVGSINWWALAALLSGRF